MVARETNLVNAFETTLAAQLASGGGSMNLADDPGVDAPVYLVIDPDNDSNREVVLWSSGTDHTAATITRDIDEKHDPDPTHDSGTKVRLAVVKQHLDEAHDAIQQGFVLEDGDGTEVTINPAVASGVYTAREVKFVEGGGIDIDWTDTDNGTDGDPYDLTFTVSVTSSDIAAGTLVTESETITSNDNDTTIPTSAAVKNYVDAETATLTNKTLGAVTLSGAVTGGDQTMSAVVLKDYAETDVAVTSSSNTIAIDLANGNTGTVTLGENVTDIDFTNVPTNGVSSFTLRVIQDGTGNRTMATNAVTVNTSAATVKTPEAAGLTLSTGANDIDLVTFLFFDGDETNVLVNSLLNFS